jgi:hypothetical protein
MPYFPWLRTLALVGILAAEVPATARAQHTITVSSDDSTSFIVPRRGPRDDEARLRTRDRKVVLVLRDTTVVMQLTDLGMDTMFDHDTAMRSGAEAIFARMAKAGVQGLFDHGIAYRLSALRAARADGGTLVLEDRDGKHVFEDTNMNGVHPMQGFDPGEAERFARLVQQKIAAGR